MIRLRVTQAGGGAWSNAALYHPLIRCHASWIKVGSAPTSASNSSPNSSACRLLSVANLALFARTGPLMNAWYFARSWRAENLLLTSLHVASEIHSFLLASCTRAFGTARCRAAKILSYLVGLVGDQKGSLFRPPR